MKFTEQDLLDALNRAKINPDDKDAVMQNLQQIAEEQKPDPADKQPRMRKQIVGFVVENTVADVTENQIYLVEAKENISHDTILPTLRELGKEYNDLYANKAKKAKITKTSDHFELLKAKFTKDKGIKIVAKEPIILVKFTN
jgi:glutamyl/glutaminyl-tRNA synthetase